MDFVAGIGLASAMLWMLRQRHAIKSLSEPSVVVATAPEALIKKWQLARDRGAAFLLKHQRADGAIGTPEKDGLSPYYKAGWALACTGATAEANRLLSWIAGERAHKA